MWWEGLVPKTVMAERLHILEQEKERYRHRVLEIENSTAWKFVVIGRRWAARLFPRDGWRGVPLRGAKRAVRVYLDKGTFALALWIVSSPLRLVQGLFHRKSESACGALAFDKSDVAANLPRIGTAPAPTPRQAVEGPPCFRVYTNTSGNYFFNEMRDLLVAGLRAVGCAAEPSCESDGFGPPDAWHIIIAPHEFFYLGGGLTLGANRLPERLIVVNTEQSNTHWFQMAARFFPEAHTIWDIDFLSSQRLFYQGLPCSYLPLGYLDRFRPFEKIATLPAHYGTRSLAPAVRTRSPYPEPLALRPLDLVFFGNPTWRRQQFFAKMAPLLARFRCYLHFSNALQPLLAGKTTYMNTPTVLGLVQRSKVLINIHRDDERYFEWQRIVMHGIWQRTLVISEPCTPAPPFRPGIDFVTAELADMPEALEYYLSSAEGQRRAQAIAGEGFRTLARDCRFTDVLKPLIDPLVSRPRKVAPESASRAVA